MGLSTYPLKSKTPDHVDAVLAVTGTGATAPTKNYGDGITVTYSAVGVYIVTFADVNGAFMGCTGTFGATTASAVKGYTMTYGLYSTTARTITLNVWSSTFAAVDLAAAQYLTVRFSFRRTGVSG